MELSIGGQQFHGKGRTRQAAKHDAAAKAIKYLQKEPIMQQLSEVSSYLLHEELALSNAGYTLHDFSPDFHSPTVLWKSPICPKSKGNLDSHVVWMIKDASPMPVRYYHAKCLQLGVMQCEMCSDWKLHW